MHLYSFPCSSYLDRVKAQFNLNTSMTEYGFWVISAPVRSRRPPPPSPPSSSKLSVRCEARCVPVTGAFDDLKRGIRGTEYQKHLS